MSDSVKVENPVVELVEDILVYSTLMSKNGGPFAATFEPGDPESRVILIAGDNASGKSFMTKILASFLNEDKIEPLQVSMRYRTMAGMHRIFMFGKGDEEDSTGNVSLTAIKGALYNAEERKNPCWVILDEPDTGLSEGYCGAMGTYLANFGNRVPLNNCEGMAIVTHSRRLASSLLFTLEKKPHFLCLSQYDADDHLTAWLEDERDHSVEELLALSDSAHETYRKINQVLAEAKAAHEA